MIRSTITSFQSGYDVQINLSEINTYHHLSYKTVKENSSNSKNTGIQQRKSTITVATHSVVLQLNTKKVWYVYENRLARLKKQLPVDYSRSRKEEEPPAWCQAVLKCPQKGSHTKLMKKTRVKKAPYIQEDRYL